MLETGQGGMVGEGLIGHVEVFDILDGIAVKGGDAVPITCSPHQSGVDAKSGEFIPIHVTVICR